MRRSIPVASTVPIPHAIGAAAAPPAPTPEPTSGSHDGDRRRHKRPSSESRECARSSSTHRRPRRHGGPHRFRSQSPPSRGPEHVDSYYGDRSLRNPLIFPRGPHLFRYGAAYGYLPADRGISQPPPPPPHWDIVCSRHRETDQRRMQVRSAPHNCDLGHGWSLLRSPRLAGFPEACG